MSFCRNILPGKFDPYTVHYTTLHYTTLHYTTRHYTAAIFLIKYFSKQSHILRLKFTELDNLQNTGKQKIKIGGVF